MQGRGDYDAPSRRTGGRERSAAAPGAESAGGRQAAASPRRRPPTPLAPSAARGSPPLFGNLDSFRLRLNYTAIHPFHRSGGARGGGGGSARSPSFPCRHLPLHLRILPPGASRPAGRQLPNSKQRQCPRPRPRPPAPQPPGGCREKTALNLVPRRLSRHPSASERKEGGTLIFGGAFLWARLSLRRACSHFFQIQLGSRELSRSRSHPDPT